MASPILPSSLGRSPFLSKALAQGSSNSNSDANDQVAGGFRSRGEGDWTFLDEQAGQQNGGLRAPIDIDPYDGANTFALTPLGTLSTDKRRAISLDTPQPLQQGQQLLRRIHRPPLIHRPCDASPPLPPSRTYSTSSPASTFSASNSGRLSLQRETCGAGLKERDDRMVGGSRSSTSSSSCSSCESSSGSLYRQYRSRMEEADQQTAYWQARAKEAEQATLKAKQECVSLRCQLTTQQCTLSSLDGAVNAIVERLSSVVSQLRAGQDLTADESDEELLFQDADATETPSEADKRRAQSQARTAMMQAIEMGLRELEYRLEAGERFLPGDLALFFPTPAGEYLAFNVGCPNHYLSEVSKGMIGTDKHFRKYYVLGRITRIERHQAARPSSDRYTDSAGLAEPAALAETFKGDVRTGPYNLQSGTAYSIVHLEPLFFS